MTDHSITPPPEMVNEWVRMLEFLPDKQVFSEQVFSEVAQWGADQQLAKDAEWLDQHALDAPHLKITPVGESLKEAMRPKLLSLKEQALAILDDCSDRLDGAHENIIRKALEALPND